MFGEKAEGSRRRDVICGMKRTARMGTGEKDGTGLGPLTYLMDETQTCVCAAQRDPLKNEWLKTPKEV